MATDLELADFLASAPQAAAQQPVAQQPRKQSSDSELADFLGGFDDHVKRLDDVALKDLLTKK